MEILALKSNVSFCSFSWIWISSKIVSFHYVFQIFSLFPLKWLLNIFYGRENSLTYMSNLSNCKLLFLINAFRCTLLLILHIKTKLFTYLRTFLLVYSFPRGVGTYTDTRTCLDKIWAKVYQKHSQGQSNSYQHLFSTRG